MHAEPLTIVVSGTILPGNVRAGVAAPGLSSAVVWEVRLH